jgi:hypothetical protein
MAFLLPLDCTLVMPLYAACFLFPAADASTCRDASASASSPIKPALEPQGLLPVNGRSLSLSFDGTPLPFAFVAVVELGSMVVGSSWS